MLLQMALFQFFLWLSNIPLSICATSSLLIHIHSKTILIRTVLHAGHYPRGVTEPVKCGRYTPRWALSARHMLISKTLYKNQKEYKGSQ